MKEEKALLIRIELESLNKFLIKENRNLKNMNRTILEEIVTSEILKEHWKKREEKVC